MVKKIYPGFATAISLAKRNNSDTCSCYPEFVCFCTWTALRMSGKCVDDGKQSVNADVCE